MQYCKRIKTIVDLPALKGKKWGEFSFNLRISYQETTLPYLAGNEIVCTEPAPPPSPHSR